MGQWIIGHWDNPHSTGLSRRDRRSGEYRAYVPDPLIGSGLRLSPDIADRGDRAVGPQGRAGGARPA